MQIIILGMGCPRCKKLAANAAEAAKQLGMDTIPDEITDKDRIASEFGGPALPALVLDGQVVSSGQILEPAQIVDLMKNAAEAARVFDIRQAQENKANRGRRIIGFIVLVILVILAVMLATKDMKKQDGQQTPQAEPAIPPAEIPAAGAPLVLSTLTPAEGNGDSAEANAIPEKSASPDYSAFVTQGITFGTAGKKQSQAVFMTNAYGSLVMTLTGAHILSYIPAGGSEVLAMTDKCDDEATTLYGGIPVCWPWLGRENTPHNGLARISPWQIVHTARNSDGSDTIDLALSITEPQPLDARLEITLGRQLSMMLTSTNKSQETVEISQVLHPYFKVGDINAVSVLGFKDQVYLDFYMRRKQRRQIVFQDEVLKLDGQMDAVFDSEAPLTLIDPVLKRQIRIDKIRSKSTIVWNPGERGSHNRRDFGEEFYKTMLCIETANVLNNKTTLAAGEQSSMGMTVTVTPMVE